MTKRQFAKLFANHEDDFLKFDDIPGAERLHARPDLCAFLLLDRLVPDPGRDLVGGASHDEIWLDVELKPLCRAIQAADVLTLVRCGVRYDEGDEMLRMFV